MSINFEQAEIEVSHNKQEIIDKLLQFVLTDTLLFWAHDSDLADNQEKIWLPIIIWARKILKTEILTTTNFDVPLENQKILLALRSFLEKLNNRKLTVLYLAALDMRSVILAMAFVSGRINAEKAFHAAFLEELWQSEKWGIDEEAEKRRQDIKSNLIALEVFLNKD